MVSSFQMMGARNWINDTADILLKEIREAWKGPGAVVKEKESEVVGLPNVRFRSMK